MMMMMMMCRNGWTIDSLFGPAKFIDTTCASGKLMPTHDTHDLLTVACSWFVQAGCNGFNLFGGLDACVNATTIVQGYTVNCPTGLNKCSQCNEAATCADCNGLPFGSAQSVLSPAPLPPLSRCAFYFQSVRVRSTILCGANVRNKNSHHPRLHVMQTCANWNTLKSSGAKVTYNGTSPTCSLTTISDDGNTFTVDTPLFSLFHLLLMQTTIIWWAGCVNGAQL